MWPASQTPLAAMHVAFPVRMTAASRWARAHCEAYRNGRMLLAGDGARVHSVSVAAAVSIGFEDAAPTRDYSGTTAMASISTRKSGWASPATNIPVMAGGLGRSPQTR